MSWARTRRGTSWDCRRSRTRLSEAGAARQLTRGGFQMAPSFARSLDSSRRLDVVALCWKRGRKGCTDTGRALNSHCCCSILQGAGKIMRCWCNRGL